MEDLLYKTPDTYRMIRVLFGILASALLVGIILLYTLDINETSEGQSGMLIAGDKPQEILATATVELDRVYVREGDQVSVGDTIAVFGSKELTENLYRQRNEILIEQQRIDALKQSIGIIRKQIAQSKSDSGNLKSSLSASKSTMTIALNNLSEQIDIKRSVVQQLKDRLAMDKALLDNGAISQVDYQSKEQIYIKERGELAQLQGSYQQQKVELDNIGSTQQQDLGKQKMSTLNLESELQSKTKILKETELSLDLKQQLEETLITEIENLTVVSNIDGSVSTLFNQLAEANVISSGGMIARITPNGTGSFYARLNISEEGIADIKPGQVVNIKLDAYNHYQYGVLKGKVINIDKESVTGMQQFYVLVSVDDYNTEVFRLKDGYKVKGEVVLGTSRLNKYLAKKIFKKMTM